MEDAPLLKRTTADGASSDNSNTSNTFESGLPSSDTRVLKTRGPLPRILQHHLRRHKKDDEKLSSRPVLVLATVLLTIVAALLTVGVLNGRPLKQRPEAHHRAIHAPLDESSETSSFSSNGVSDSEEDGEQSQLMYQNRRTVGGRHPLNLAFSRREDFRTGGIRLADSQRQRYSSDFESLDPLAERERESSPTIRTARARDGEQRRRSPVSRSEDGTRVRRNRGNDTSIDEKDPTVRREKIHLTDIVNEPSESWPDHADFTLEGKKEQSDGAGRHRRMSVVTDPVRGGDGD